MSHHFAEHDGDLAEHQDCCELDPLGSECASSKGQSDDWFSKNGEAADQWAYHQEQHAHRAPDHPLYFLPVAFRDPVCQGGEEGHRHGSVEHL